METYQKLRLQNKLLLKLSVLITLRQVYLQNTVTILFTDITKEIWGNAWESTVTTLRTFMTSLRRKIETEKGVNYANPGSPSLPKENTVRGVLVLTEHTLSLYTLEGEERESVSW